MNKKYKKLWIEALESGKYRQTQGRLAAPVNKKRAYCCLGVLCEVAGIPRERYTYDGDSAYLSPNLLTKFEITDIQQSVLTKMNDEELSSFKEIAQWIKENL